MEVVIVGAGVLGCSIAFELAGRGARPTVLDRHGDAGHGSTSASCGIVRRFYSTSTMTNMAQEGAGIWADWRSYLGLEDDVQLARFERPGMLLIPPVMDEGVERQIQYMREVGVDVELLSSEDVAERFEFLDVNSHSPVRRPGDPDFFDDTHRPIAGAIFERDAGYVVSPTLATQNLRQAAERRGASFQLGHAVVGIRRAAGERFCLELEDGTNVEADVVVNAAGPHSAVVNRMAGVTLPIETKPLRREVCALQNPAGAGGSFPVVGDLDSGIYFRPESGGRDLIVGSLDPDCDPLEWVADPDEWDESCSPEGFERQVLRLMKRFPEVRLENRRGLAGLYDVTPLDWNPVLDRTEMPGYYVAIGTSGSSFKTAPVIGSIMAELIDACEAGRDHDHDPVRVTLPRTGFEVDVAFFSRTRGAHATSGTVLA